MAQGLRETCPVESHVRYRCDGAAASGWSESFAAWDVNDSANLNRSLIAGNLTVCATADTSRSAETLQLRQLERLLRLAATGSSRPSRDIRRPDLVAAKLPVGKLHSHDVCD